MYREYYNKPEGLEQTQNALRIFNCLATDQIKEIIKSNIGFSNESRLNGILKNMTSSQYIFLSKNKQFAGLNPIDAEHPKAESVLSFWLFLEFYSTCGENYALADFPSQIVFQAKEKVYRITMLSDPKFNELTILKAAKKLNVTEIFFSIKHKLDDIPKDLYPSSDFFFVETTLNGDYMQRPTFKTFKVSGTDSE